MTDRLTRNLWKENGFIEKGTRDPVGLFLHAGRTGGSFRGEGHFIWALAGGFTGREAGLIGVGGGGRK